MIYFVVYGRINFAGCASSAALYTKMAMMSEVARVSAVISTEYVRFQIGRRKFTENVLLLPPQVKVFGSPE